MLFSVANQRFSRSIGRNFRVFSLFSGYSSKAAEIFINHLHNDPINVEKSLNAVNAKLDARCVTQVLENFSTGKPQLSTRFFIWAGLQPNHRHTSFMFQKACKLLDVEKNPGLIVEVVNCYMDEGLVVGLKMFKLILNLCRAARDADLGLWVLRKMKEFNCRPDTVCYNVVIRLLVDKGKLDLAMELMKEMGLIDLYPDNVSYVLILKGLCDAGRIEAALDLVKVMKRHGCVANAVVYSMLLDGMCNSGDMESAFEFLREMEKEGGDCKPNVVTYTSLIKSLGDKNRAMEALEVLNQMIECKIKPNRVTLAALLDGLCREGRVAEACKVIERFKGSGFHCDELFSMLVMSLLRAGKDSDSEKMLWTMISEGMNPNGVVLGSIIRTMVSSGRVLDGFLLFDAVEKSGRTLFLTNETCSCLLDALRRENRFSEAAKVAEIMSHTGLRPTSSHDPTSQT